MRLASELAQLSTFQFRVLSQLFMFLHTTVMLSFSPPAIVLSALIVQLSASKLVSGVPLKLKRLPLAVYLNQSLPFISMNIGASPSHGLLFPLRKFCVKRS